MNFESNDLVSKLSSVDAVKKMLDLMDESVLMDYPKNSESYLINTTKNHCLETARFFEHTLSDYNIDSNMREALVLGALLHDVGKVTIPVDILYGNGLIDKKAIDLIKSHSEKGAMILREVANVDLNSRLSKFQAWQWDIAIALATLHHNFKLTKEYRYPSADIIKWLCAKKITSKKYLDIVNDKGYGELFAVCDVYSAVSSGRVYSKRRLENESLISPKEISDKLQKCESIDKIVRFEIDLSETGENGLNKLAEYYFSII